MKSAHNHPHDTFIPRPNFRQTDINNPAQFWLDGVWVVLHRLWVDFEGKNGTTYINIYQSIKKI